MNNRELDAAVAERVMGWVIGEPVSGDPDGIPPRPSGGHFNYPVPVPSYSTDISAAYQMEERIKELGLIGEYCFYLNRIADAYWYAGEKQGRSWQLIHATPADRCRAALKATSREDTNGAVE